MEDDISRMWKAEMVKQKYWENWLHFSQHVRRCAEIMEDCAGEMEEKPILTDGIIPPAFRRFLAALFRLDDLMGNTHVCMEIDHLAQRFYHIRERRDIIEDEFMEDE